MALAYDIGALQTTPGASIGPLRNASTSTQNIDPSGLASGFAAGSPTLEYNQDISPGGKASDFAAGSPTLNQGFINPTGKPSDFATGVPTLSLGTITPPGKASDFAAGKPTLNLVQAIIPTGKASDFAAGLPSLIPAQTIDPTGLASSFAAGSPTVSGGPKRISPAGLASSFATGVPKVVGPSMGVQVFLGGVEVTKYISLEGVANQGLNATTAMQPLQLTSQTLGRWTAQFDFIDLALVAYPEIDQTFLVMENGVKLMSGGITVVAVDRFETPESTPIQCYHVTAQDWSAICDRRVVPGFTYQAGTDIALIVRDIWTKVLLNPNEGITANHVPAINGPLGEIDTTEVFNFVSVTTALNQLATDTGCVWFIDVNADLWFVDYTTLPNCPYQFTDSSLNWRALSASATLLDYRNVQWVVSNLLATPGLASQSGGGGTPGYGGASVTETYVLPQAAALARGFELGSIITNLWIGQLVQVKVNGQIQPFYNGAPPPPSGLIFSLQKSWWYYPGFPFLYPPNAGNASSLPLPPVTSPYPNNGDTVEITYIPIAGQQSSIVIQSSNGPLTPATPGQAGTWGSGVFENVQQVKNLNIQADLNAIAGALLNRSDTVPIQIQVETDEPGAQVGQSIYINIPTSFLEGTTQWTITQLQMTLQTGPLEFASQFRTVMQATSGQDLGNSIFWLERLLQRTENPLPVQQYGSLQFVLAPGGSLAAGVPQNNPVPLTTAGLLSQVYVMCGTPPTGQSLVIDVKDNGVSILATPIVIPAASGAQVTTTAFASPGLTVAIGDLLEVDVSYQVTGAAPTPAANVTVNVQWLTTGLPAGQIQPGVYQSYT